ncbi:hypothetical protein MIZ01_0505 [Sideroxyarcus emersonii]|uniref:Uncharacterized protein n=1 Tax=Sideroxyarcus emersonii TaxID=2764705 RepID=A0AAN2BY41_9PROT|nr:hypothetical protein [Sideroxyarcus emersonii]BCK86739.1 hypothetical protein MIZ01_0505 [Sideroxyarcus emersonii]
MNPTEVVAKEPGLTATASSFFDEHGRCIPSGLAAAAYLKSRHYFAFAQPSINYADIHARIQEHFGVVNGISAAEFEQRAEAILQTLRNAPETKGIADGVRVPFLLPKASYPDYGEALEKIYLPAVQNAFAKKFPTYAFVNHHKGGLVGKLGISPLSRHQRLLAAMHEGPVVGYLFPCLTEYSIPAALEQTSRLPEQFLLAGGFDTSAALTGSPDMLLRTDGYPPLLWLAALTGEKENVGYHFEAYGYNLTFNRRPHFGQAAEYWASGLVVLG